MISFLLTGFETSFKAKHLFIRIHRRHQGITGYFHTLRTIQHRTADDARSEWWLFQNIPLACKKGYQLETARCHACPAVGSPRERLSRVSSRERVLLGKYFLGRKNCLVYLSQFSLWAMLTFQWNSRTRFLDRIKWEVIDCPTPPLQINYESTRMVWAAVLLSLKMKGRGGLIFLLKCLTL